MPGAVAGALLTELALCAVAITLLRKRPHTVAALLLAGPEDSRTAADVSTRLYLQQQRGDTVGEYSRQRDVTRSTERIFVYAENHMIGSHTSCEKSCLYTHMLCNEGY